MLKLFSLSSRSSAFYVSSRLTEEGYVTKDATGKLIPAPGLFSIPLLGHVRAGFAARHEGYDRHVDERRDGQRGQERGDGGEDDGA